jgi:hypothetical protein
MSFFRMAELYPISPSATKFIGLIAVKEGINNSMIGIDRRACGYQSDRVSRNVMVFGTSTDVSQSHVFPRTGGS